MRRYDVEIDMPQEPVGAGGEVIMAIYEVVNVPGDVTVYWNGKSRLGITEPRVVIIEDQEDVTDQWIENRDLIAEAAMSAYQKWVG